MNLLDSKSKAAGLSDSTEPSSFNGVRHFWQYMVVVVHFGVGSEVGGAQGASANVICSFAYLLALAPAHHILLYYQQMPI